MFRLRASENSIKENTIDLVLDVINIGFDYARRAVRKGLEKLVSAVKRSFKEDSSIRARSSTSLESKLSSKESKRLGMHHFWNLVCRWIPANCEGTRVVLL